MFCPKCGNKLPDNARFCDKCGNPVSGVQSDIPPKKADEQRIQPPEQSVRRTFGFAASAAAGETALGSYGGVPAGAISGVIPGPGKVIGAGLKSLFTSIGSSFKDPKRLIPAFVIAAVWLVLNILQACGINPVPTRILSFLTFANGGMSGGFFGAIGGVIGKGIFAGALVSLIGLFTRTGGEKRSFKDTVKGAFGVCMDMNGPDFDYWIADNYVPWEDVPEGCETLPIPGGLWAEFPCRGPLPESLQRVNTQIWSEWLPSLTGYTLAGGYSLELYAPPAEDPADDVSYIWIPLKKG